MATSKEVPTKAEMWHRFRAIDMTPFHMTKNNLTYVPWSRAYAIAMDEFGDHLEIRWHGMTDENSVTRDITIYPGGTASVCCSLHIGGEKYSEMSLAVMDYANRAIVEPTSVDIQNARQRCQTKLLASIGLGLYLWENDGEFPSQKEEPPKEAAPKPKKRGRKKKAAAKEEAPVPPTNGEIVTDLAQPEMFVGQLTTQCKKLIASGWEPDDDLKNRIRAAVKDKDVKKMVSLIEILDTAGAATSKLNDDSLQEEVSNA